jgi:hypothetical protein
VSNSLSPFSLSIDVTNSTVGLKKDDENAELVQLAMGDRVCVFIDVEMTRKQDAL